MLSIKQKTIKNDKEDSLKKNEEKLKFYQDRWIKDHSPYTEKDWIAATTEDIFKMQSTREIHSINGKSCFLNRDNYGDLETILVEESQDIDI